MGGTDYGYKYYSSCKAGSLATVGLTDHGLPEPSCRNESD